MLFRVSAQRGWEGQGVQSPLASFFKSPRDTSDSRRVSCRESLRPRIPEDPEETGSLFIRKPRRINYLETARVMRTSRGGRHEFARPLDESRSIDLEPCPCKVTSSSSSSWFDRVCEAWTRSRHAMRSRQERGRSDGRRTRTDSAALSTARVATSRVATPRVRPPAATSSKRELAAHIPERNARLGAARRDACCAASRAEGETTWKKLRRMHATVVRASLNSRVLLSACTLKRGDAQISDKLSLSLSLSDPLVCSRSKRS